MELRCQRPLPCTHGRTSRASLARTGQQESHKPVKTALGSGASLNLASRSGLGHAEHATRPILSGCIVACPPIPQACCPTPRDWHNLRSARSAVRELWLVSGCVLLMTFDWTGDGSNFTLPSLPLPVRGAVSELLSWRSRHGSWDRHREVLTSPRFLYPLAAQRCSALS